MRRTKTTIHPALSRVIDEAGHTDTVVIADAGLPIPIGAERIDLAYRPGHPTMLDVLDTVLMDLVVEQATLAEEVVSRSPELFDALRERFEQLGIPIVFIPHEDLKHRSHSARAFVRTGEYTPFANVILRAGVPF